METMTRTRDQAVRTIGVGEVVSKLERGDEFAFVNVPSLTRTVGEVGRRPMGAGSVGAAAL